VRIALLAVCLTLVLAPAAALADGFYVRLEKVGVSGQMVSSPRQEAVIIRDGTETQVILRTHFAAGPKELAWIIPVPAAPTQVGPADDKLFETLEARTAPVFTEDTGSGGGMPFGCGCGYAGRHFAVAHLDGVIVEGRGTAGIYDWTALGATDAAGLQKWLNSSGYALPPGATPVLDRYVRQGWHWLAVKVRVEESDKPTLAPHPITFRYKSAEVVYPLAISQLSAAEESEVVLYVFAADRYNVSNWPTSADTDRWAIVRDSSSHSGTNYEKLFREETRRLGGHLFITECADRGEAVTWDALPKDPERTVQRQFFVTRLRAVMSPKAMDRDVELRSLGTTSPLFREHPLRSADSRASLGAPLGLLAVVGAGLTAARCLLSARRRWLKGAGLAALILAMLAISAF
jgi:hypothetical protein